MPADPGAVRRAMPHMADVQRAAHSDLMSAMQAHGPRLSEYFMRSLRQQVAEEMACRSPAAPNKTKPQGGMALVHEDEVAMDVELSHTIEAIKNTAEYELRELQTYTAALVGDMNVAHREIDLARPKENTRNAGFTTEEREAFDQTLDAGFVDTFRHFDSGGGRYTWWSYQNGARDRNIGWRIDYFCASEKLKPALKSAFIHDHVRGSDHCPVGLIIDC
jgi:hypothetical protein